MMPLAKTMLLRTLLVLSFALVLAGGAEAQQDEQPAAQQPPAESQAAPAEPAPPQPAATPTEQPPVSPSDELRLEAANIDEQRSKIAAWKATLDRIEVGLLRQLDDDELSEFRRLVEPIQTELPGVISSLQVRAQSITERIAQLGEPPAADGPPEPEPVARARDMLTGARSDVGGVLSQARVMQVQIEQLSGFIAERRRDRFAARLAERNRPPFDPSLWADALPGIPSALSRLNLLLREGTSATISNLTPDDDQSAAQILWRAGIVAMAMIIALGLIIVGRRRMRELYHRAERHAGVSRMEKYAGAAWMVVVDGIIPFAALLLVTGALNWSDFLPDRLQRLVGGAMISIGLYLFLRSLVIAILAPRAPDWRMTAIEPPEGRRLARILLIISALTALDVFLNTAFDLVAATLSLEIMFSGTHALLVACLGAYALRILGNALPLAPTVSDTAEPGPPAPEDVPSRWRIWMRSVLWIAVLLIFAAAISGYIALAAYGATQVVLASAVVAFLAVLIAFTEAISSTLVSTHDGPASAIGAGLGLQRGTVDQLIVVLSGIFRVFLIILGVILVLLPWGFDTGQWTSWIRAAFFGFQVGEITISLSSVLSAILIFIIGLAATRAVQRWLNTKYLPRTKLDVGLKTSVATAIGYAGIVAAAAVAVSFAGFDLASLAIVAGALSLGIGFGLQSIVNNFVSGLILLAERPVKVGDWIDVAGEQGYVRNIKVRATEIQTFDRASVIVPNSDLISGVVKNMMHSDRIGRIRIPVGVSYDTDPEQVRQILLDIAAEHDGILSIPEPRVYFLAFGDSSLDFSLYAFLSEVDNSLSVSSDLRYQIFARFREAGIEIPFPQRDLNVRGTVNVSQNTD